MSASKHNFEKSLAYNEKKGCKEGYRKRESYKTADGVRVPARCVRSTTVYKNTVKRNRANIYIPSVKTLARKVCPPGMIERKAYTRKFSNNIKQRGYTVRKSSGTVYVVHPKVQGSTVKPTCVKDKARGTVQKKRIGPLRKGELSKFGYSFRTSSDKRHKALRQAIDEFGALGVHRKLDAVAKLSKTTLPEASRIFESDRDWIDSKFGPLKAFEDSKK
jgi:hypothetical protein